MISCYFKTNCINNATKVWVKSKFFYKTSASFSNYGTGQIHHALIPVPVPAEVEEDKSIPFEFQIEADENGEFSLELSAPGYNTVTVSPFHFNKGITTRSYGLLESHQTPDGSGWYYSNVAFSRVQILKQDGSGAATRGVIFGYYDDPENPATDPRS